MRRLASLPPGLRPLGLLPLGVAAFFGSGLLGCGRGESLMPLNPGREWTYSFRTPFQTFVEQIEVTGETAVGSGRGAVLTGPMGTSRLGWVGDTLLASRLANAGFSPPIPVVVQAGGRGVASRGWKGTVESFGLKREAVATMVQTETKLARNGARFSTIKSELRVTARPNGAEIGRPPTQIEVTTYFRPGIGIVEQEQHTNRKFILELKLLD